MHKKISWPNNKSFAFTIFDDTDRANLKDNKLVYKFLDDLNFKTTKSVWVKNGISLDNDSGVTCDNQEYLKWLLMLKEKGFEIGYHNVACHSSRREEIELGLKKFINLFSQNPNVMANHSSNKENIYWGSNRLTGFRKSIYNILTRFKKNKFYKGEDESSPYFWGDLCKKHVKYVRNFVFSEINTLKICPNMPYEDPLKPYVNYWFAASEGNNVKSFNQCISDKNQDRLEQEGGACIMYTHFADGFCKNNNLSDEFKNQMERLSKKNGWFVPVFNLLEFLREKNKTSVISNQQRRELELKWLLNKLTLGST
tara:strand:- start:7686 stop:8618 length:933 start_codon:yes stop_codon:yes gene_type:complete